MPVSQSKNLKQSGSSPSSETGGKDLALCASPPNTTLEILWRLTSTEYQCRNVKKGEKLKAANAMANFTPSTALIGSSLAIWKVKTLSAI